MKIAITVSDKDYNSEVDPRFGRAPYFMLVDTESGAVEHKDNSQNLNSPSGAGIQAAETVSESGAEALLTGHCGPKAFRTLSAAGIKVVIGVEGPALDAVEKFKTGIYEYAEAPDVSGHW